MTGPLTDLDDEQLLIAALEVWRKTPATALGWAIQSFGERVAQERPALEAGGGGMKKAWLARAALRNPADLSLLTGQPLDRRFSAPVDAMRELAAWPTDPRISAVTQQVIGVWQRSKQRDKVLGACLDLLRKYHFEPVTLKCLHSWRERGAGAFKPLGRVIHGQLDKGRLRKPTEPKETAELVALIELLKRRTEGTERTKPQPKTSKVGKASEVGKAKQGQNAQQAQPVALDALWAEVYAEPDADEPLQALAAALQAAGDPRGTFITLQMARAADARPSAAERKLLAEHEREWMGPWAELLATKGNVWRRGLLVEVTNIRGLPGDPRMRALEAMHCARGGPTSLGVSERDPAKVPRLRTLTGVCASMIADHAHDRLETLEVIDLCDTVLDWSKRAHKAYPAVRRFSARQGFWSIAQLRKLLSCRFGRQLEHVAVGYTYTMPRLLDQYVALVKEHDLTLRLFDSRYVKGRSVGGWQVVLAPGGAFTLRNKGRSPDVEELRAVMLAAAVLGLTITVEGPKAFIKDPPTIALTGDPEVAWRVA